MFSRPVDESYPIRTYYGQKDKRYKWSMDPDNGFWLPRQDASGFGQHRGTDFECPTGTIVRAMADGMVVRTRHENPLDFKYGAGLYILQLVRLIGHDSWILRYSHLKSIHIKPGDFVCRYDAIAESGDSGDVQSPYLHVDLMNLKCQYAAIQFDA